VSTSNEFEAGYYGWRVAFAAGLGVMAGFGSLFVYTFPVFVKPLGAEFGWTREAISRGFAFCHLFLLAQRRSSPVQCHGIRKLFA
jgi:hypothetical protein